MEDRVPCAAALATIEVIDREALIDNVLPVAVYTSRMAPSRWGCTGSPTAFCSRTRPRPAGRRMQRALWERRMLTGTATNPEPCA